MNNDIYIADVSCYLLAITIKKCIWQYYSSLSRGNVTKGQHMTNVTTVNTRTWTFPFLGRDVFTTDLAKSVPTSHGLSQKSKTEKNVGMLCKCRSILIYLLKTSPTRIWLSVGYGYWSGLQCMYLLPLTRRRSMRFKPSRSARELAKIWFGIHWICLRCASKRFRSKPHRLRMW